LKLFSEEESGSLRVIAQGGKKDGRVNIYTYVLRRKKKVDPKFHQIIGKRRKFSFSLSTKKKKKGSRLSLRTWKRGGVFVENLREGLPLISTSGEKNPGVIAATEKKVKSPRSTT